MFIRFKPSAQGYDFGYGIHALAHWLDYALSGNTSSRATAIAYSTSYREYSTANAGNWVSRFKNGGFNSTTYNAGHTWAWSQSVVDKPDQPFFHKGFAVRCNVFDAADGADNNCLQGYMGSFQDQAGRNNVGSFDYGRPLNTNYTTNISGNTRHDTIAGNFRKVSDSEWIVAAAQGYMFLGNLTRGTFWAVMDGTVLPIHEYTTSAAIPMIGLSGMQHDGSTALTKHWLRVLVHKYDSGSGAGYNQLISLNQDMNSDSSTPPNSANFLKLYPTSASNQGLLDRFDSEGKKTTALYPFIIGNPILGNAYQTADGIVLLSGQNHETGQTFYIGSARYFKFVCTHDYDFKQSQYSGLTIGIPIR